VFPASPQVEWAVGDVRELRTGLGPTEAKGLVHDEPLVRVLVGILVKVATVETEESGDNEDCNQGKQGPVAKPERFLSGDDRLIRGLDLGERIVSQAQLLALVL
jgi:hypothetical protein